MTTFHSEYEFARTTQRMVLMVHRTEAIRRSPCPYVYVAKELFAELWGAPPRKSIDAYTQTGEPLPILTITIGGPDDNS